MLISLQHYYTPKTGCRQVKRRIFKICALAGAVRSGRARQPNACCGLDIGITGSSAPLAGGPAAPLAGAVGRRPRRPALRPGNAAQLNACARLKVCKQFKREIGRRPRRWRALSGKIKGKPEISGLPLFLFSSCLCWLRYLILRSRVQSRGKDNAPLPLPCRHPHR